MAVEFITDPRDTINLSLTKRVRSGFGWNASSTLIGQVIGFARSIVIARLLAPEDFGLFGMALTVQLGLNALTRIGLDQTIIARRFDDDNELRVQLDTVWSAELVRSALLSLLVLASAYPMARFYHQPKLLNLILALSLATFIEGFQNIGLTILRRQLSFARIFWYDLLVNTGATVLGVVLAVVTQSVWALVFSQLFSAVLSTTLSYLFHPFRPRFAFEKIAFKRVLDFGRFAVVIAIASYVTTMADNVAVGRLLGTGALGNYALAYSLASFPIGVLVHALGRVTLPAFAELASSAPGRLEYAFTKVFTISSLSLVTMTVPLFLLADDIVHLLFGGKWISAGPALRILSLIIPLRGLVLIISFLFFALNRPKPVATGKALEAAVFLVIIFPLIKTFGLTGAAWAGVVTYAFALLNRLFVLRSIIPDLSTKLIRVSLTTLAASGTGLLITALALSFLTSTLPRMLLGGILATTITPALLLLIRSDLRKWIFETVH